MNSLYTILFTCIALFLVGLCLYINAKKQSVGEQMRNLWTVHVYLTHNFIQDTTTNYGGQPQTTQTLLDNQVNLGNNLALLYGRSAGDHYAQLLKQHILIAANIVQTAIKGEDITQLNSQWQTNGEQIADFLCYVNKRLDTSVMRAHMKGHLETTLTEAVSIISGDYEKSTSDLAIAYKHIMKMVDYIESNL